MRDEEVADVVIGDIPADAHDRLDELSDIVETARSMPMSSACVINRGQVLDLLDDLRALLPEDLASARAVLLTRDQILADARASARDLLEAARVEHDRLVSRHEVTAEAVRFSTELRAEATGEAERLRRETDEYIDGRMGEFEDVLVRTLRQVESSRDLLAARRPEERGSRRR